MTHITRAGASWLGNHRVTVTWARGATVAGDLTIPDRAAGRARRGRQRHIGRVVVSAARAAVTSLQGTGRRRGRVTGRAGRWPPGFGAAAGTGVARVPPGSVLRPGGWRIRRLRLSGGLCR